MATILSVIPYHIVPPKSGGQNLIAGFTDFLGKKHKVIAVSTNLNSKKNPFSFELLSIFGGTRWRYLNFFHVLKIIKICKRHNVQYLISEHPFMAHFAYPVSRFLKIPFYLHNHNIEFDRNRTLGKWWWRLMKIYEGWAMRKAEVLFFVTAYDKDLAIRSFKVPDSKCFVVPYGIYYPSVPKETKDYRDIIIKRHHLNHEEKILLFFGALRYQPNYKAVELILEKINPLLLKYPELKYKILICGKGLPDRFDNLKKYADQNILNIGFVDDIDEYIHAADVILNPVITGGGIKTKVVEALGFDKNVVSTLSGATGVEERLCGRKLLTSRDDDWEKFVSNIFESLKITEHTPESFFDFFYWGNIVKGLDELFE